MALCDRFLTPLVLIPEGPKTLWRVAQDFSFQSEGAGLITVPAGFVCDLSSLPRIVRPLSTPADFPRSGVLHDWAYTTQMPRRMADALYREALTCERASRVKRWARWAALRAFGWAAYRSHQHEE